jgi:hypothetical protein
MGVTNFQLKNHLDPITHTEVNTIYGAINNIESAIEIDPGSQRIILSDENITSLDASKLVATSDAAIRRLSLSEALNVSGNATFDGVVYFGNGAGIKIYGENNVEIIKLGTYTTGLNGLLCTDGTNVNLLVSNQGKVSIRGTIEALTGSKFTGEVNIEDGIVTGDLEVGGSTGIVVKGGTKEIVVGALGKIKAGTNELTSSGFSFNQGTINIGTKFLVDATGKLTARDVDISGKVTVSSGDFELYSGIIGGAIVSLSGIYVDGFGSATTGWSLGKDGYFYAKKANITGVVNATGGTITGEIVMSGNGKLVLPGVTFDSTGPKFTTLNLSLGSGKFNLNNGNLQCTNAIVTGQINMTSGNVVGTVTIGGNSNIRLDGAARQIVAGNTRLGSQGIDFKQGTICLGSGPYGPAGDEKYRFYLSGNGYLVAKDVSLQGLFEGELSATSGTIGGWLIDSSHIFAENTTDSYPSGAAGEINRSLFVMHNGSLTTYSDREAIGSGHSESVALIINNHGLTIPNGDINITTGINGERKVVINSTGIRAQRTFADEVVIDSGGIKSFKNGADLGYIITPEGLEPSTLKDHSLTATKFNNIAPNKPTDLTYSIKPGQLQNRDTEEVVISWKIPTKKTNGSDYTDPAGFKIYLKDVANDTGYPCMIMTDYRPDNPDIIDPENPMFNVKSIRITNLKVGSLYGIKVAAFDRLGNESAPEEIVIAIPKNIAAPPPLYKFDVTPLVQVISCSWNRSTDERFSYYEVERCASADGNNYSSWQLQQLSYILITRLTLQHGINIGSDQLTRKVWQVIG